MSDLKTALAKKNGYNKQIYVEKVRKGVRKICPNQADENAIFRGEIALLRKEIEDLKGQKLPETKFSIHNSAVEEIKEKEKKRCKHNAV